MTVRYMLSHEGIPEITVEQLKDLIDRHEAHILIDVRSEDEYAAGRIPGAVSIPLDEILTHVPTLAGSEGHAILVYCRDGRRSTQAVRLLREHRLLESCNVVGGLAAWARLAGAVQPDLEGSEQGGPS